MRDPSLIIPTENIEIKHNLSYEEIPDLQVLKLRTKEVASVKVLWRNQFIEESIWEAEEDMKKRYPHLFESGENADQAIESLMEIYGTTEALKPRSLSDRPSLVAVV
ncbi:hypothetical protein MTR67_024020 [Solanum verrucosum]|uniref:Chromo domain-containing protein n=1 Tax=Solanum verrucosum TaxID=315347 RepID=A0AAF0QXM4_SOLVR|nr:hypothetical protein MTR67_024020 [Solanum verrucosum]